MDSSKLQVLRDALIEAGFSDSEVERVRLALRPGSLVVTLEVQAHLDAAVPDTAGRGREISPGVYAADHVYPTAMCSRGERMFLDLIRRQRLELVREAVEARYFAKAT